MRGSRVHNKLFSFPNAIAAKKMLRRSNCPVVLLFKSTISSKRSTSPRLRWTAATPERSLPPAVSAPRHRFKMGHIRWWKSNKWKSLCQARSWSQQCSTNTTKWLPRTCSRRPKRRRAHQNSTNFYATTIPDCRNRHQ